MSNSFPDYIRQSTNKLGHRLHPKRTDKTSFRKWKVADEVNFSEGIQHLVSFDSDCATNDDCRTFDVNSFNVRHRAKWTLRSPLSSNEISGEQNCSVAEATSGSYESRISDPFHNCEFIILDIEEGDSLQSVSLKYHCPVSDLKRANNLISSQEFYALRQLKVPIKKYGLLKEKFPSVEYSQTEHPLVSDKELNVKTVNIGIGPMVPGGSKEDAIAFFRRMDEDLVKIMLSTKSKKDSLEAATVALTSPRIQPLFKENAYSGVDFGIQWCSLLILIVVIGIVLPFIVIVYMYSRHTSELTGYMSFDNSSSVLNSFNTPHVDERS